MQSYWQFIKYGIIGLSSNVFLYLVYLLITKLGVEPKIAMSILYMVGVLQTFFFNKKWTFRHKGDNRTTLIRYSIAYLLGYLVNLFVLVIFVDIFSYPHEIVQAIMIFVLAVMLFLLQKFWVFKTEFKSEFG